MCLGADSCQGSSDGALLGELPKAVAAALRSSYACSACRVESRVGRARAQWVTPTRKAGLGACLVHRVYL
jgi:hypothetical protein